MCAQLNWQPGTEKASRAVPLHRAPDQAPPTQDARLLEAPDGEVLLDDLAVAPGAREREHAVARHARQDRAVQRRRQQLHPRAVRLRASMQASHGF